VTCGATHATRIVAGALLSFVGVQATCLIDFMLGILSRFPEHLVPPAAICPDGNPNNAYLLALQVGGYIRPFQSDDIGFMWIET
jgi:hypothetical protein